MRVLLGGVRNAIISHEVLATSSPCIHATRDLQELIGYGGNMKAKDERQRSCDKVNTCLQREAESKKPDKNERIREIIQFCTLSNLLLNNVLLKSVS